MAYIIYGFYNLVYQVLSICILVYANTYINGFLIPDSLRWKDGKLRENLAGFGVAEILILVIETGLLTLIIYAINKWFLRNVTKANNPIGIARRTSGIHGLISLVFVGVYIYVSFT